jgi:hypothetical protein
MDAFCTDDGPILVGPFADLGAADTAIDRALAAAQHRQVAQYVRGVSGIVRRHAFAGSVWIQADTPVVEALAALAKTAFSVEPEYDEDDEWGDPVGASRHRLLLVDGAFFVAEDLRFWRPAEPCDVSDMLAEALCDLVAANEEPATTRIYHEAATARP